MADTVLPTDGERYWPHRSLFGQDGDVRGMLVLVVVGCTQPPPALEFTSNPIAVGAIARGELPALASASIDPADIFSLATIGDRLELVAQTAGTANLTVTNDEDFSLSRIVEAVAIDQVIATPARHGAPCEVPALFTLGARASIPVEVHGGGRRLNGEVVPPVVASGEAIIVPEASATGTLEVRLPGTAGTVQLTSPVDAAFAVLLETVAPSAVDALTLGEPDGHLIPVTLVDVPIDLAAGGRALCGDTLSRTIVVETPTTCKLGDGSVRKTMAGIDAVSIRGLHTGDCTIRVSLDGTPLTVSKTLTVSM